MSVSQRAPGRLAYALTLVAATLAGALYYFGPWDEALFYVISNALPPALAFVAVSIALLVLEKSKVNWGDRYWVVWVCYAIGMLFWFLGEFVWAIYVLFVNVPVPYPSVADIFWLAGYLFFFWAMFVQVWPFREAFSRRSRILGPLCMLVLAGAIFSILLPATLATWEGLSYVIAVAYPIFDVGLLTVAVPVFLLFRGGKYWRPIVFVIFGIIMALVGDIWFALATLNGSYYNTHPLELFFLWSYLAFTLGFYLKFKQGVWSR